MYFKREGITLQPDLVLLTYVGNDIEENRGPFNPWAEPQSFTDRVMKVLGKLWSYRLAHHTYRYVVRNQLKREASNPLQGGEGWNRSMSALGELVAMCEENTEVVPVVWTVSASS